MLWLLALAACDSAPPASPPAADVPAAPAAAEPPVATSAEPAVAAAEPAGELAAPSPTDEAPPPGKIEGAPILERPVVLGGIAAAAVDSVIAAAQPAIDACYTAAAKAQPGLAGKVLVRFTVGADGSVSSARTKSSSLWNPGAEDCLTAEIGKLRFPAPMGGGVALVTYPFVFPR